MKKLVFLFLFAFVSFFPFSSHASTGDTQKDTIYFSVFTRADCLHCIELKNFLSETYTWAIQPKYYDIDQLITKLMYTTFVEKHELSKVTPIILIGNKVIVWFDSPETTGKTIQETTNSLTKSSFFEDPNLEIEDTFFGKSCQDGEVCENPATAGLYVKIPFIWVTDLREYSLPFLSALLWFIDGFNPCAMWVLVMFLTILSQANSRKKMVQIAGTFIIAEAIMYYLILNVWYKTWDFVQLDSIVSPIIGLLSIGAGAFFIYEFFTNKEWECKVTTGNQKRKIIEKIKLIIESPMSIWIFAMTIGVAFSVNVIEFACSVGIPQAFTKLLELSSIAFVEKQFYMFLYILFYMFDDLLVFWVAIYAFQHLHLTTKYTRYSLMLWGLIMIGLGYLFLFHPVFLKSLVI